jgi:hypothetical protein
MFAKKFILCMFDELKLQGIKQLNQKIKICEKQLQKTRNNFKLQ